MPKGISIRTNGAGIPVFWLHYSAKKDRDEEWVRSEKPKYSEAMWNQEQEMDFSAAGGERVLKDLLEAKWKEIVITDPQWGADPKWTFGNGLDYGKSHPTSFHAHAIDFDGCRYSLAEHYRSGNAWTPEAHTRAVRGMKAKFIRNEPLLLSVSKRTRCDPSMGFENVATDDRFTSLIALFSQAGFPGLGEGIRGGDLALVDEIRQAWTCSPVKYKIVCRNMPFPVEAGSMRKREGTYEDGCPNLLWELLNLRRKEWSAAREETNGAAEGLVDKENDAFDDLKYWWRSNPHVPMVGFDEKWRKRVGELRQTNPEMDLNSLVMYAKRFEAQNQQKVPAWH